MANVLAACEVNGARLVFVDGLYMLGPQVAPLREDMPLTDQGVKPAIPSCHERSVRRRKRRGFPPRSRG